MVSISLCLFISVPISGTYKRIKYVFLIFKSNGYFSGTKKIVRFHDYHYWEFYKLLILETENIVDGCGKRKQKCVSVKWIYNFACTLHYLPTYRSLSIDWIGTVKQKIIHCRELLKWLNSWLEGSVNLVLISFIWSVLRWQFICSSLLSLIGGIYSQVESNPVSKKVGYFKNS